jgi:large subunit ribosomal protein L3
MTRVYTEDGRQVPVTVIEAGPCYVSQIKTPEKDGYAAVQVAFDDVKARRSTMPQIGHDLKAGLSAKRVHREFRVEASELENYEVGQELTIEQLAEVRFVDVSGRSKGKGYQGVMKRHGFKGQLKTHGVERKHRSPGSISSHASNAGLSGKIKKGKKMAGQLGNRRVTVRALDIIQRDPENHVLLVKGPVPGPNNEIVEIRPAKRIYKVKQNLLKAG